MPLVSHLDVCQVENLLTRSSPRTRKDHSTSQTLCECLYVCKAFSWSNFVTDEGKLTSRTKTCVCVCFHYLSSGMQLSCVTEYWCVCVFCCQSTAPCFEQCECERLSITRSGKSCNHPEVSAPDIKLLPSRSDPRTSGVCVCVYMVYMIVVIDSTFPLYQLCIVISFVVHSDNADNFIISIISLNQCEIR